MYPITSMNYNTHIKKDLNMHHTNGNAQAMEKNIMGQRVNFIRDPNRIEKKMNPKIGGWISLLWPDI